jgi:drug/metabolite transporter (DMT)-like permease
VYLSAAFFMSGVAALIAKTLVASALEQYRNIYFISIFATMLLISLSINGLTRRLPSRKELIFGGTMGIAGIGNYWFIVRALRDVPGIIAFPFRTCGSILLTLVVSRFLWKETLRYRELAGVILAMSAIVLMSL